MFEYVDTELNNMEIHGFKTPMLNMLDKYISDIRAEAYECSIVMPSLLPDSSMSCGGGTKRENAKRREEGRA